MAELQEPITLDVDAAHVEAVAAALQAAADADYTAEVEVHYNDPGFTPSGGGTITIDVVYNDSGGPSGGSTSTTSTSSKSTGKSNSSNNSNSLFSKAANTIQSWANSIQSKVSGLFHAEGGRSDVPAIFGEAGPEWAIPEEHSDRTAELLNAAREASGFSWNELIARYGGLNGRSDGVVVNIGSYAPVITAQDSRGVEQKLIEDKDRLKRLVGDAVRDAMERNALHDAIEVYA